MNNTNIIMEVLKAKYLSKAEFLTYFKNLISHIKKLEKTNSTNAFGLQNTMKGLKEKVASPEKEISKLLKKFDTQNIKIDNRLKQIQNGKDGKDADIIEIIKQIPKPIKLTPKEIRDTLELLKGEDQLKLSVIEELKKEIEELKKIRRIPERTYYGGSVNHKFMDDETPSGVVNGSNTDFILAKAPIALKVFRGGARQRITEDYTLAGKIITFLVAPVVGEIILCDYRYF